MNIKWNAENYKEQFSFVPAYGEDVLELLTVLKGKTVFDLGCGNGRLTQKIAEKGYRVIGIDDSLEMLALAEKEYPKLKFFHGNAVDFKLEEKADAIFSNAVFHWIDESRQENMIKNISEQLKPGGELVCEFGGQGCAELVHSALEKCFKERGLSYPRTFYFPTIGQYAPLLEKYGLKVEYAVLFDRPTVQKAERGLVEWIKMFVTIPFLGMEESMKQEIFLETEEMLRDKLYIDGKWYIDYVRIRLRARKNR